LFLNADGLDGALLAQGSAGRLRLVVDEPSLDATLADSMANGTRRFAVPEVLRKLFLPLLNSELEGRLELELDQPARLLGKAELLAAWPTAFPVGGHGRSAWEAAVAEALPGWRLLAQGDHWLAVVPVTPTATSAAPAALEGR
jgi:hypothetical protein